MFGLIILLLFSRAEEKAPISKEQSIITKELEAKHSNHTNSLLSKQAWYTITFIKLETEYLSLVRIRQDYKYELY
jgi:hypothetical protein